MEAYTERLRDHLDLDALTAELLAVVDQTAAHGLALAEARGSPSGTLARSWTSTVRTGTLKSDGVLTFPAVDVSGVLATRIAGKSVVPTGRAVRRSRANVRNPAAAQAPTASPFALDRLPGTRTRRPRSVAGWGRAFGALCFAGKLRSSPGGPGRRATVARGPNSTLDPTRNPTLDPTPATCAPAHRHEAGSPLV